MSKRLFVVANWKMNPDSLGGATKLFSDLAVTARTARGVRVVACPPMIWLSECKRVYRGKMLALGAQDVSSHPTGAHTGEISAPMLASLGVGYVIVGHSERRAKGETLEEISAKIKQVVQTGLTAILCIGEHARDDHGEYLHVLRAQIVSALSGVTGPQLSQLIVAYEPIWAIGKTAADAMKPELMHETSLYIRKIISEKYGFDQSRLVPVLYGGSVEGSNAETLLSQGEIDGFLVGHASLSPLSFGAILKCAQASIKSRS